MINIDQPYHDSDPFLSDRDKFQQHAGGYISAAEQKKPNIDFNSIVENITDIFFILNNEWTITYWNREVENISGLTKDQITGQSFFYFFSNPGSFKLYAACRRAKYERATIRFEEYYESANVWIEVQLYPSEDGLSVFFKNVTEKKIAEAAMKLSNERYDMVVKATNDLVWDWDILKGEIYRNSTGIERVFGHSSNDHIKTNQQWQEHIHPDDRKAIDELIAYYISSENESSFNFEYRFKREDGNYNYINDRGYIIRNELGIVTRMIGAARDITGQKQIARNIEESEQRYKMFVQQSTEGIWRIELDKAIPVSTTVDEMVAYCMKNAYIAECNDAFAKMYGYENAANIIGMPLSKLLPKENPANLGYLYKFFTNNFKVSEEISFEYDQAGNQRIFSNNMLGIVEHGFIQRAWGIQREITNQKKAEELLLASEEQYRHLFNFNPSCIFIWDPEDFNILEVNESAVALYGYSREEFKFMSVLDLRPKDEHEKFMKLVDVVKKNDDYKKTRIWKHIKKDGETIFMEISSHAVQYNGKKTVLAIGNNVTEKVQLENSLNEERQIRQKQITDAVITGQERERLELGEELHDNINQILASTRLYMECALTDDKPRKDLLEKGRVLLDSAMAEIRKLSKTLLPPSLGEVSLLNVISDLVEDVPLTHPMEIKKDWDGFNESGLDHKLKLTIFRIIQEQLNNIYKHSKATQVKISLQKNNSCILVSVKDDGIGFNTTAKRNGVGLRNITSRAEVNNGSVNILSEPGEGCDLQVIFQLAEI